MATQPHCHLSSTLTGAPENAPDQTYKAVWPGGRRVLYEVPVVVKHGLTGKLHAHRLMSGTTPVLLKSFELKLKVTPAELAVLELELGNIVYFVDFVHGDDGADHTAYVRQLLFQSMSQDDDYTPKQYRYNMIVKLIDADTVT